MLVYEKFDEVQEEMVLKGTLGKIPQADDQPIEWTDMTSMSSVTVSRTDKLYDDGHGGVIRYDSDGVPHSLTASIPADSEAYFVIPDSRASLPDANLLDVLMISGSVQKLMSDYGADFSDTTIEVPIVGEIASFYAIAITSPGATGADEDGDEWTATSLKQITVGDEPSNVTYTVTSKNKENVKTYTIKFVTPPTQE